MMRISANTSEIELWSFDFHDDLLQKNVAPIIRTRIEYPHISRKCSSSEPVISCKDHVGKPLAKGGNLKHL